MSTLFRGNKSETPWLSNGANRARMRSPIVNTIASSCTSRFTGRARDHSCHPPLGHEVQPQADGIRVRQTIISGGLRDIYVMSIDITTKGSGILLDHPLNPALQMPLAPVPREEVEDIAKGRGRRRGRDKMGRKRRWRHRGRMGSAGAGSAPRILGPWEAQ